jgi:hypothetical protein
VRLFDNESQPKSARELVMLGRTSPLDESFRGPIGHPTQTNISIVKKKEKKIQNC